VIQAMAGGTVSELTGGDFANGAVSAAVQFAFNQLQKSLSESQEYVLPAKCATVNTSDAAMSSQLPPLNSNAMLSVLDVGTVTFISGEITVGGNGALANKLVKEGNQVFGNSVTEGGGRTFFTNITFSKVSGDGMLNARRMSDYRWKSFRDNSCRIAGAWTPKGGNEILFAPAKYKMLQDRMKGTLTGAHEIGHFLGLVHTTRSTAGIMSYAQGPWAAAYGRTYRADDASLLADRNRLW
jgi:hypothetical protein